MQILLKLLESSSYLIYGNDECEATVRYIGVIQKKKVKKSDLRCFLLTERAKTGVLEKNKIK